MACWAAGVAVLGALAPIVVYIWIAAHRLDYPYEFDWIENGAVNLVGRVLAGKSLYTAPTLAYVSYTYPPLYTWVSAAVAAITGLGFLPLRLVSFTSSLVAFIVLWRWARAATADRAAGVVTTGLFAATYGLTGWWFDVGRLDSMFVALTLLALWVARSSEGVRGGAAAGAIAFLAFFTKQITLVAVLPAFAYLLLVRPRTGLSAVLVLIVSVAGSTLLLDALTDNWYKYYVVGELAGQPWQHSLWIGFWHNDLYGHLRPLTLLILIAALTAGLGISRSAGARFVRDRPKRWPSVTMRRLLKLVWQRAERRPLGIRYDLAAAAGLLVAAWLSRLHTGGYANVLIPAYAACALLGGIAFAALRRIGPLPTLTAVTLVLLQILLLLEIPNHALPTKTESGAGAQLIAELRSLPGPILVLGHPWYGTLVGKGSFAQADAIKEVLRSDSFRGRSYLRHALNGSLERYHIQAVVLDGAPPDWLEDQLIRDFRRIPGPITRHPFSPPAEPGSAPTTLYVRVHGSRVRRGPK